VGNVLICTHLSHWVLQALERWPSTEACCGKDIMLFFKVDLLAFKKKTKKHSTNCNNDAMVIMHPEKHATEMETFVFSWYERRAGEGELCMLNATVSWFFDALFWLLLEVASEEIMLSFNKCVSDTQDGSPQGLGCEDKKTGPLWQPTEHTIL
jgi:hypothetical protein